MHGLRQESRLGDCRPGDWGWSLLLHLQIDPRKKAEQGENGRGGPGDVEDAGDCSGARYNDWSDDDDDSNESKSIVWYPPWARIGTEAGTRARARARARATRARRAVQKRASPNSDDTVLSPQELQKYFVWLRCLKSLTFLRQL